jgi:hypothetical protein
MKTKDKAQSAAPVAPSAGIKRINLAGIATKSPASKTAKAYPVLPDEDGQVAALVEDILDKSEQLEALEGSLEIDKAEPARAQGLAMPCVNVEPVSASVKTKLGRGGSYED